MMRIYAVLVVLLAVSSAWAAEYLKDPAKADSWVLELAGSARATLQAEGGAIRIDVTSTSSEAWHVQVVQNDKSLQRGKRYTLSFAAKASSPRTIHTYGQIGIPPWDHIWPAKALNLTTEYQTFSFDVAVDRNTDGKGRIPVFAVGQSPGTIWIMNASVRDASDPVPAVPAPAAAPAPAPAGGGAESLPDLMTSANDPAKWTLEVHGNAIAQMRSDEDGLRVDVTRSSDQRWHVQLHQAGKTLTPGKTYVLKLQAKASAPRRIAVVTLQQADDPWHPLAGQAEIDLGSAWKQYTLRFRVNADASGQMRSPIVQLGEAIGTVWLRNVTLTEALAAAPR